ncbi:hypothetical protein BCV72DRAFT_334637 [Rhizopus microsporus var. microsporus]|uniref:FAR1 domain-containing protein n=2 Tax=Rhizopus microsporus TaxID=58291 RepID=A0A2G4SIQ7_RHIZD|nr:uncharacterized protein RHIMIDRAFT_294953 [Rhizopus microsporus ATCC 52813]ORE08187.1 hypothetical protein BCV72DRAFT_334637 [Rhizopus microsporus var. microsporus]PHZ08632.1 hypothetical protein RHIMIDRAFT_294953 [Rhizopus microsporus ATCC 52813]
MTKRTKQNNEQAPQLQQGFTPERQQEQALFLEPFYERLMGITFSESAAAIEHCRDLCAEYGFTVKQEASTHRNIYVYCSREGLPDSLRNPKSNPQRKRPSKRCDCRWRVVLFENEGRWEFRKSLNPEAGKHNHELMHPDEIERSWPKEVTDLICELARLRMTTQDIRTRVQAQFPHIHWNERRFYNRLSEERQKIKQRDTTERTHDLCQFWSKICALTTGNEELTQFVKGELSTLYQILSEAAQVDDSSLPPPTVFTDETTPEEENNSRRMSKQAATSMPKGYLAVDVPRQTYYIKIHNQRLIQEAQVLRTQRRRTLSMDAQTYMMEPERKMIKKGKGRESSLMTTPTTDDRLPPDPIYPYHPYPNSRASSTPSTPTANTVPVLTTPTAQSQRQPHQRQAQMSSFVYYDSGSMSLDSPLSGYVHPQFQNTYHMNTAPSPSSFNPDMQFPFDPSHPSIVRGNETNNPNNTIHPVLQTNAMVNKTPLPQTLSLQHPPYQQQQQQQQQQTHSQSQQHPQRQQTPSQPSPSQPSPSHQTTNTDISNDTTPPMYSMNPLSGASGKQPSSSQIRMYDSAQGSMMARTLAPVEAQQQSYHHTLYMRQASHHPGANAIMPMYSQQQQQQQQSQQSQQQPQSN